MPDTHLLYVPEEPLTPPPRRTPITAGRGSYALPGCAGGTWLDVDLTAKIFDGLDLGGLGPDSYRDIVDTENHWTQWNPSRS